MEHFDLKCLPTDFVGTSKPSKVITALYEKKEKAEKMALEQMQQKKQEICSKYDSLLDQQSEEIKRNLDEIRGFIKNELYDVKIRTNYDNACLMDKEQFKNVYKRVQDCTSQQHDLVETFYLNLIKTEKDKSKELTDNLKEAYETIKRISFKLPREYDELIELEIEKINQTILCNNRNYCELKSHLQAGIQNNTKNAIQELQHIKELWIKRLKTQASRDLDNLKQQYIPDVSKAIQTLTEETQEISVKLSQEASTTQFQNATEWLDKVRQKLAYLDKNSQKIITNYKQAAVIIYNRFFQDLKSIEEGLKDMVNEEEIPKNQTEMYTPSIDEIKTIYEAELEKIQTAWNDLIDQLTKTFDNTYKFLLAGAILWEKHFKRTEILQLIMLRDMENTIKLNNSLSEPYETKLNVLIDTLRQEPTKEKMKKTFEDIVKLLVAIEGLYKNQYQSEVVLLKKYKSAHELRVDVLLSEVKRFLTVYPPDLEKDPKIQRKRASQTSEITDSTEGLIPNQMIFCKYQIGAISNWQFGLWECIGNYMSTAREEILADTDKWLQSHIARLERRLDIRLGIHGLRMGKLQAYIYEERLEELCFHQNRIGEHQKAVGQHLELLKKEYKFYQDMYDTILKDFKNEISDIEIASLDTDHSWDVAASKPVLQDKTEKCIEDVNKFASEYLEKLDMFVGRVKCSHIMLCESMKLFSERGNFSIYEIKDILKSLEKTELQVDKDITSIKKEVEANKITILETIHQKNAEVYATLKSVIQEHKFNEGLASKLANVRKELIQEVCMLQSKFKTLNNQFEQSKTKIQTSCGNYEYLKEFADGVQEMVQKLNEMTEYLDEALPVRFYSDKSTAELPPAPADCISIRSAASTPKGQKTAEESVKEITEMLFNFQITKDQNTLFINLNKILRTCWDDIVQYAKAFYIAHHRCFFLEEDKVHHNLIRLMKDMYKKFFHMQNQCETRTMQDLKEYIYFTNNYLGFIDEYTDTYIEEYTRKTLKNFENLFENEVRYYLKKSKVDVRNQYLELQKKLKTLYGHPKNRRMLEKLQIEAEIINSEAIESFKDIKYPQIEKLQGEFCKAVNDYYALRDLIPKITECTESLKTKVEDLSLKLNEKVTLLRMMINYCPLENSKIAKDPILSHCKSFLTFYESHSLPQLLSKSKSEITEQALDEQTHEQSTESDFSVTQDAYSSKNAISTEKHYESCTTLNSEDQDIFLAEIRECYDKYCREVEGENFKEVLSILKNEWDCTVKRVLDLYCVKYDKYKTS